MTFKSKALGFLAGSALALSLTAGALATDVTATLNNNPDPWANCWPSIWGGTLNLGTWEWNGYGYQPVDGAAGEFEISVTQDLSADTVDCDVSVSGGPLYQMTNADGDPVTNGSTINLNLVLNDTASTQAIIPTPWNGVMGSIDVSLANLQVQSAGSYKGAVTITASTSS